MYRDISGLGFKGFPKLGVPICGFPITRIIVQLSLYWGPPIEATT